MAKGIDINGTLRGKRGGVVYYRRAGEQNSRVKVTPKNPKSAKQAVQRMVLATASKIAAAYEPIVNHSFEGVEVGSKSVQVFRSQAMHYLRAIAGSYLNDPSSIDVPADFAIKGAPTIGGAKGLYISRGTLGVNGYSVDGDALKINISSALSTEAFTTQAAYEAELAKLGVVPGDQLTFVAHLVNLNEPIASMSYDVNKTEEDYSQAVRFCRVVFTPTIPNDFSGTLISSGAFNESLIAEKQGELPFLTPDSSQLVVSFSDILPSADWSLMLTAMIRSQKQEDGTYKYSTAHLESSAESFDANDAYPTYLSYMDGASTINVGDTLYLRHAVAAPFE